MSIRSTTFGAVRLSGKEAQKSRDQVTHGKPKKAASATLAHGRESAAEFVRDGFAPLKLNPRWKNRSADRRRGRLSICRRQPRGFAKLPLPRNRASSAQFKAPLGHAGSFITARTREIGSPRARNVPQNVHRSTEQAAHAVRYRRTEVVEIQNLAHRASPKSPTYQI